MEEKIMKRKYWIVYLNKSYDVWARDAWKWAEENGFNDADHNNIISEVVFWSFLYRDIIGNKVPVYFVKDIITEH